MQHPAPPAPLPAPASAPAALSSAASSPLHPPHYNALNHPCPTGHSITLLPLDIPHTATPAVESSARWNQSCPHAHRHIHTPRRCPRKGEETVVPLTGITSTHPRYQPHAQAVERCRRANHNSLWRAPAHADGRAVSHTRGLYPGCPPCPGRGEIVHLDRSHTKISGFKKYRLAAITGKTGV